MKWAESLEETLWATHAKPVFEYLVNLAELIALAAVFYVAARRSESLAISTFSLILKFAASAYAGLPWGFAVVKLNKLKTTSLPLALAIGAPIGLVAGFAALWISIEMSHVVENLANASIDAR